MATSPKRWLWIINVVAILLGAWLAAGTVNAMISARMSPADSGAKRPSMANAPSLATKPVDYYLDPIKSKNVFNHGEPVPDEGPIGGPAVAIDAPPDQCTLSLQVQSSVIVENKPEYSVATLMDNSSTPPKVIAVRAGDRVAETAIVTGITEIVDWETFATVTTIEFMRDDGRRELCSSGEAVAAGPRMPLTGAVASLPTGEGIKRISDTQFEVSQSEIDAVMNGGMASMAQDVRIVPYFEGGVAKGFKLYSIKPGSLLSKIGLMNGDVIQKVNGYDISSPEKALQVYGLLKNEKNVQVDLTRNGQNKTIGYGIR